MTASTFPEMVRRIFRQQTTAFKINGTGNRVVVGFLVAFSVVYPLKFFSADVTGIGL
jgi:hypothetical protein